jgi:putative ABC transport system permease protein
VVTNASVPTDSLPSRVLGLVMTNLARRKARAFATAVGIALGVATVVALLSVGSGLNKTAGGLVHLGDADAGIFQSHVSDPTASLLPVSLVKRLEARPDIASATPLLLIVESIKPHPESIVFGADPQGFFAKRLVVTDGTHALGPGKVMIGDHLAKEMHLKPGGALTIKRRPYTVAGIYHTGIFFEDGGAVLDLHTAQRIEQRSEEATTIVANLATDAHHDQTITAIKKAYPDLRVISDAQEAARAGANGQLVQKTVTIVAALALIVGGLGVLNTMAMAVLERRREIALLGAIGWKRLRLVVLVLTEGVVVSMGGAALGLLLGVIGARGLNDALGVSAVVTPDVTPWTLGKGLLIGFAIGVVGGLYPAWRGTGLDAAELLASA